MLVMQVTRVLWNQNKKRVAGEAVGASTLFICCKSFSAASQLLIAEEVGPPVARRQLAGDFKDFCMSISQQSMLPVSQYAPNPTTVAGASDSTASTAGSSVRYAHVSTGVAEQNGTCSFFNRM